ncbi:MAG: cytochrome c oxidase assembly protein [Solirubrobacteraceae bacterium]
MNCESARETISASADGELGCYSREELDAHLDACAECRRWREGAHAVTRRLRLGPTRMVPGAPTRVLAAAQAAAGWPPKPAATFRRPSERVTANGWTPVRSVADLPPAHAAIDRRSSIYATTRDGPQRSPRVLTRPRLVALAVVQIVFTLPALVPFAGMWSLPLGTTSSLHLGELLAPLLASAAYLTLWGKRVRTLAREGRPLASWRVASFVGGALTVCFVQLPPFDSLADEVLVAHMVQHIVIGDLASLLMVLGLTGPVLQPLLESRRARPLLWLASPIPALVLWAGNLYLWQTPLLYQLAVRHDLVHALEHVCLLWCGLLLWLALLGPLPKPAWFHGWAPVGYVAAIRLVGAALGNALIWAQTVFYPVYKASDAARGLNPLSDQNLAGAAMTIEQMLLTIVLLGWLFVRFTHQDGERQALPSTRLRGAER